MAAGREHAAPSAADSKGPDNGTYTNSPTLNAAGAIAGDTNTAVQLDGVDDYVAATRTGDDNFSIELWFKSSQGIGTGTIVDAGRRAGRADLAGIANDYGLSLRSDGRIVAGWGPGHLDRVDGRRLQQRRLAPRGVHPGRSVGALMLYVDGAVATAPAEPRP